MLKELHIRNFALIEELELSFYDGFSVLTGETGAGKSIIIDALSLLLGARASGEMIRSGFSSCLVEGSFSVTPRIKPLLAQWGIEEVGGELIITREIYLNGRNKGRINGRLATVGQLAELGPYLVDIVGQHDSQSLLKTDSHLGLLDSFGGPGHLKLVHKTDGLFQKWQGIRREQRRLEKDERERIRRIDLLTFQVQEISEAGLETGEEEALAAQQSHLANLHRIRQAVEYVHVSLSDSLGEEESLLRRLGLAEAELLKARALDESLEGSSELFSGALLQLEEVNRDLRYYLEELAADPQLLQQVELRLQLISNLKRKYGGTIAEILAYGQGAKKELHDLENSVLRAHELEEEARQAQENWLQEAGQLSEARLKLAAELEKEIENELAGLNMTNTRFSAQFTSYGDEIPRQRGREDLEFMISPNLGEDLKPLAKIASGGELSRIMLAMKAILAEMEETPTVIFDEIDAGLGGRTAVNLGEKLHHLSKFRQVFCVTHLPTLASYAANHYHVQKATEGQRTKVEASFLDTEERVLEIVRMLGGSKKEGVTTEHARELLQRAYGS